MDPILRRKSFCEFGIPCYWHFVGTDAVPAIYARVIRVFPLVCYYKQMFMAIFFYTHMVYGINCGLILPRYNKYGLTD